MNQFDRIYALDKLLSSARHPVPNQRIQDTLECSPATVKRIIRDMRLYLDAPIEYHREFNGYYYSRTVDDPNGVRYELPGLWFNESEILSLLVMDQMLETTQPGLLDRDLGPIRKRLESILKSKHLGRGELARRVRVLRTAARPPGEYFQTVAGALASRWRMQIDYHGRARDSKDSREISPQRLTYYRDNWYLDAWCHRTNGLRTFALDRIRAVSVIPAQAEDILEETLDRELAAGYGIFSGAADKMAILVFCQKAARWVADEQWHPHQQHEWFEDGRYQLSLPYSRAQELIKDILAHGPDVEVLAPNELRQEVKARLSAVQANYT